MAAITHDPQSLQIDGRRIWLVCGSLDYFRIPRSDWEARLDDAVFAGLNTILVRCPWGFHEQRPGDYTFEGDVDVVEFIELIRKRDLRCILRPGPFVGSDLDFGGMPAWLLGIENLTAREGNSAFLEATSRYFGALLGRLQKFSASRGGPIIMVQVEHQWYCGNQTAAQEYLLELARFIREHDFDVPLFNTNDLYQRREETMDTWSGRERMLEHLRQFRSIQPRTPLLVGEFQVGDPDVWGRDRTTPPAPRTTAQQLGQVFAAGAQVIIAPFFGGTNFGFSGGRLVGASDQYVVASADCHAPVSETGIRNETFRLFRRLCLFASQFERVFSALDWDYTSAVRSPEAIDEGSTTQGLSVVHLRGGQGEVVFVLADPDAPPQKAGIVLRNGKSVPVHLDDQPFAWLLLNVHLGGRARLDWTNLNALMTVGKDILVLYGSPGQVGYVSINYSQIEIEVPKTQSPSIVVHEDVTIVVCNYEAADACAADGKGNVVFGVSGMRDGQPMAAEGWKSQYTISPGGDVSRRSISGGSAERNTASLGEWSGIGVQEYLDGSAPRYARIDGPATQEQCSADSGYGFVRMMIPRGSGKKLKLLCPGAADRLHLYVNGEFRGIVGYGPGADRGAFDLAIPTGKVSLVAMIDNLGRYAGGNDIGEGKGVISHIHQVATLRMGKATLIEASPIRPFTLRNYLEGLHNNEMTSGIDLYWSFMHRRKTSLILEIDEAQSPAVILINDEPVEFFSGRTGSPTMHFVIDTEKLKRGKNELRLAPLDDPEECDLESKVRLYEIKSSLTDSAEFSFAKWQPPKPTAYAPLDASLTRQLSSMPAWYRATFTAKPATLPLWFEPIGMTKGQVFLNGRNAGRYFVSTRERRQVGPQKRVLLPTSWLKEENELVIFEEHGRSPAKSKLVYKSSAF